MSTCFFSSTHLARIPTLEILISPFSVYCDVLSVNPPVKGFQVKRKTKPKYQKKKKKSKPFSVSFPIIFLHLWRIYTLSVKTMYTGVYNYRRRVGWGRNTGRIFGGTPVTNWVGVVLCRVGGRKSILPEPTRR